MYKETTAIYAIINKELFNLQGKRSKLDGIIIEATSGIIKKSGFEEISLSSKQILKLMQCRCRLYHQFEKRLSEEINSLNESKRELSELNYNN
jgi:hypothetical protein